MEDKAAGVNEKDLQSSNNEGVQNTQESINQIEQDRLVQKVMFPDLEIS